MIEASRKNAGYFVVSGWLSSALSYGFILAMTRLLPPANFAAMQSIFALSMIGMVAGQTLRLVTVKTIASKNLSLSDSRELLKAFSERFRIPAIVGLGAFFLVAKPLTSYLGFNHWVVVPIAFAVVLTDIYFQLICGCIQGAFEWIKLSVITVLFPVVKLISAVLLTHFCREKFSEISAETWPIAGLLLSNLVANFAARKAIPKSQPIAQNGVSLTPRFFGMQTLILTGLNLSFVLLIQIDSIIGNKVLPLLERGNFAVLCMMGKIFLYLVAAISPLVFSYRARRVEDTIARPALAITAIAGFIALPVGHVFGPEIVTILFGQQYILESVAIDGWLILYTLLSFLHILTMEVSAGFLSKRLLWVPLIVLISCGAALVYCQSVAEIGVFLSILTVVVIFGTVKSAGIFRGARELGT